MKKTGIYISALLLVSSGMLLAQGEIDAYRLSQSDLNGSARSMSMGGAFGALGGDMSAMSHNPAGLGVYRSSEVQTTLSLNSAKANATWTGINSNIQKTRTGFDNFSYVGYFPTANDAGIRGWNIGIAYNKVKDFNRSYKAVGSPIFSMADYVASWASNAFGDSGIPENDLILTNSYDPYKNGHLNGHWLSILGYESGFIGAKYNEFSDVYHSAYGRKSGDIWMPYSPNETTLRIGESGSINEYNFSLATNISDFLFLGATLGVTSIEYRMSSWHNESFGEQDYLILGNSIETEGTGYSFNLGAIIRPINQLRFGIAYNSPKWYLLTDHFDAYGESYIANESVPLMEGYIPEYSFAEYSLQTPGRWIFSAASIIGQTALLSLDYEITNYNSMYLADRDWNRHPYSGDNSFIKEDFKKYSATLKAGAELKFTPRFAIRGGFVWQQTPVKNQLMNNDVVVYTAGTIPHYTVSDCTNYYTAGLGYRFSPNFYMDLALIYRVQKEKLYPFSSTNSEWDYPEFHLEPVYSQPADISLKTMRMYLTLGYKF